MIAEGKGTKEIALRLNISAKTVETHRARIQRRLNIHDVAGLVRHAVRVGLVKLILKSFAAFQIQIQRPASLRHFCLHGN